MIKLRVIEQIVNGPNLSDEDKYEMIKNIVNDKPVFDVGEVVVKTTYSPGGRLRYCHSHILHNYRFLCYARRWFML